MLLRLLEEKWPVDMILFVEQYPDWYYQKKAHKEEHRQGGAVHRQTDYPNQGGT